MIRWLVIYLVHSTVVYALASALRRRARTVAAAETLWRSAMFVPLVSATGAALSNAGLWTVSLPAGAALLSAGAPEAGAGVSGAQTVTGDALITTLFLVCGLLLAGRDVIARLRYLRGFERREMREGRAAHALRRLSARTGIARQIRLTCSDALDSPVAINDAEICIPVRAVAELGDRELEALLAHELKHLLRRDPSWLRMLALVESLLFVQPLHRRARRELQRLAERDCDRWAATQVGDAHAMAACLVDVAAWAPRRQPAGMAAMAGGALSERIDALLQAEPARQPSGLRMAWAVPVVVVTIVLPSVHADQAAGSGGAPSAEYRAGFEAGRRFHAEPAAGRWLTPADEWRAGFEAGSGFLETPVNETRPPVYSAAGAPSLDAGQRATIERAFSQAR
jgi:beta-lactamase regulating signal transducer with metallopeptidase domain